MDKYNKPWLIGNIHTEQPNENNRQRLSEVEIINENNEPIAWIKTYRQIVVKEMVDAVNKYHNNLLDDTFPSTIDELIEIADKKNSDYTIQEVKDLLRFLKNLYNICKKNSI